jgi:predicted enzyme related to lactoylglutathione lyase
LGLRRTRFSPTASSYAVAEPLSIRRESTHRNPSQDDLDDGCRRGRLRPVTASVFNVSFDCADPYRVAQFWSAVTGRPMEDDAEPGDEEVGIELGNGTNLFFQWVPESKTVKNRVHVCLKPDQLRDAEVERVIGLGARWLEDHREPDGRGWVVLADPEGNEFCMLRHNIGE